MYTSFSSWFGVIHSTGYYIQIYVHFFLLLPLLCRHKLFHLTRWYFIFYQNTFHLESIISLSHGNYLPFKELILYTNVVSSHYSFANVLFCSITIAHLNRFFLFEWNINKTIIILIIISVALRHDYRPSSLKWTFEWHLVDLIVYSLYVDARPAKY